MTSWGTVSAILLASSFLLCTCLLSNIFILEAVLRRKPASPRGIPTNEVVISNLALVSLLNGVANFLWLVVYLLGLCQHTGGWVYQVLDFASMTAASTSFWFTACLSAFYTLRISSFSPLCLARLRLRVPAAMPCILLFLFLACSALSGPTITFVNLTPANGSDLHCGDYYEISEGYESYIVSFTILGFMLPLAALTTCSILLVVSLCLHSRRMGGRLGGSRNAVHLRVAKMVLVLLAFYAICVVLVQISDHLYVASGGGSVWFVTYSFVLLAYSAGCPVALTWGTVRLHQRFLELCSLMGCRKTRGFKDGSVISVQPNAPKDAESCTPGDGKSVFVMSVD
ncbi:hypothetical protein NDU88_000887 [Pleurodeles waltl]|uniref:Taste receptor type 2 n=1 Tax=Pleurodeles waltl TaxID=8319 RepID=A0AAV7P3T5_PLEWA|nr:hypothetical protein NDU88_000887 [Pleurodeles waltl]